MSPFLILNQFSMGNTVFGGLELAIEHFAGVPAGEVAGFRDRMEDLDFRCAVDREIVD